MSAVLYLSCVEDYLLDWYGAGKEALFCQSYVPASRLLREMLVLKQTYERYEGLPRLQHVAERLGAVRKTSGGTGLRWAPEDLVLMRVNRTFFERYRRVPWREDHYIRVEETAGGFRYVNQYPADAGFLVREEWERCFGGVFLVFQKTGIMDERCMKQAETEQLQALSKAAEELYFPEHFAPEDLRGAVGVWKVSRARLEAWARVRLGDETLAGQFSQVARRLEKLFLRLEVGLLRGRVTGAAEREEVRDIAAQEASFLRRI